ncbi:hypothetical protein PATSB16_15230 [Pandoraea thiooxydans]|nr:hypothetical protein PATSB16_15230 [Pandoraea thiooxydans]
MVGQFPAAHVAALVPTRDMMNFESNIIGGGGAPATDDDFSLSAET